MSWSNMVKVGKLFKEGMAWPFGAGIDDNAVTTDKLAFDGGALSGFRNVIINGGFNINQKIGRASCRERV